MDDFDFTRLDYADSIGIDEEHDDLVSLCKSRDEVDALLSCLGHIDYNANRYVHAVAHRPKDPAGRKKAYNKLLRTAKSQQVIDDTLMECEAVDPIKSTVQEIKDEIFLTCKQTMKEAGMGKKKWLLLRPLLTKYLYRPLTKEERIDARVLHLKMNRLLGIN